MDTIYGGSSQTIGVSCIIPAIPGVNTPLNDEQQSTREKTEVVKEEDVMVNKGEDREETSTLIEENSQIVVHNANDSTQLAAVKTFYSK
jgi:hypothetical protein